MMWFFAPKDGEVTKESIYTKDNWYNGGCTAEVKQKYGVQPIATIHTGKKKIVPCETVDPDLRLSIAQFFGFTHWFITDISLRSEVRFDAYDESYGHPDWIEDEEIAYAFATLMATPDHIETESEERLKAKYYKWDLERRKANLNGD